MAEAAAAPKGDRGAERAERQQRFDEKKEIVAEIKGLTAALGWGKDTLSKQFKAARSDHATLRENMRKEATALE
eukprot:SAG22_NODE_8333_length_663_cov_1.498227_1_plen_73_part_10